MMSATVDIPKMVKYMDVKNIVYVEGWTYPVEVYNILANEERKDSNYIDNILANILQIHTEEPPGDILVFLTG